MKYLELQALNSLARVLSSHDTGDMVLDGRVECYTCKLAGQDYEVRNSVESRVKKELSTSPKLPPASPLGPMSDKKSRMLLVSLITTLNAMFPDYDFRNLEPEKFNPAPQYHKIISSYVLKPVDRTTPGFSRDFWSALEEVIAPEDCEAYTYVPGLPKKGNLWNINFFLYNKRLKRILFFQCVAVSKIELAFLEEEAEAEAELTEAEESGKGPISSSRLRRSSLGGESDDEENIVLGGVEGEQAGEGEGGMGSEFHSPNGVVDTSLLDPEEFGMTSLDLPSSTWFESKNKSFAPVSLIAGESIADAASSSCPSAGAANDSGTSPSSSSSSNRSSSSSSSSQTRSASSSSSHPLPVSAARSLFQDKNSSSSSPSLSSASASALSSTLKRPHKKRKQNEATSKQAAPKGSAKQR